MSDEDLERLRMYYIRNHAFYGDEATEILNLCTAKDATIATLTRERDDLKGRMEIAGKLILNYIAGPFEFYTPIKPVVLMTKENHDALKQTLEVKP